MSNRQKEVTDAQKFITSEPKAIEADDLKNYKKPYRDLLELHNKHYERKNKQNRGMKIAFFVTTFFLIVFISIMTLVIALVLAKNGAETAGQITVIISAFASVLSIIIILPMIIAKYLYPQNEDKEILHFVKSMRSDEKEEYLNGNEKQINDKIE